jgi:hypothetical protein
VVKGGNVKLIQGWQGYAISRLGAFFWGKRMKSSCFVRDIGLAIRDLSMAIKYVMIFFLVFFGNHAMAFSHVVTLSESELQSKITTLQPYSYQKLGNTFTFNDVKVELTDGEDTVYLTSSIKANLIGGIESVGAIGLSGKIRYISDAGEFFIDAAEIQSLNLPGVNGALKERLIKPVTVAAQVILSKIPVYRLNDTVKQKLAKGMIKSVKVKNKKIFITLGL